MSKADSVTKDWILNASDELAVKNGCAFDPDRAAHVCDFIECNLKLYEGECAGEYMKLMPWQHEFLSRAFGWVRWSNDLGRWIRRFRKAFLFVPKKNGKSPLAAAVGLYMLCMDGEKGQKIYSAAKDGKQARIVHQHAQQMVLASPWLMDNCEINKSIGRITFQGNNFYDIIAGDNPNSQEGLNGSCIIDEVHVVDRKLAKILEFMGASRSEPLDFAVSTYGNDPMSWGKEQNDHGKAVERGLIEDQSFLHKAYEIPAGTPFEDGFSEEIMKIANPSWGYTIRPDEMKDAANRARSSLSSTLTFRMYRLNEWQTGANPWLRQEEWDNNGIEDFELSDYYGSNVWLGLDLSKTRDTTALVMCFKVPTAEPTRPEYVLYPYFWVPEKYARENETAVPFLQWHKEGLMEMIPGEIIKQSYIRDKMTWIEEHFNVQSIAYDPTFAADLIDEHCEGKLGWDGVLFKQSMANYAGPTENFEAEVAGGTMKHPRHNVLTWQAGNVQIKEDGQGRKQPVKDVGTLKKIDGIVAAVMAFNSAYNDYGGEVAGDMYLENDWMN